MPEDARRDRRGPASPRDVRPEGHRQRARAPDDYDKRSKEAVAAHPWLAY